MFWSLSHRSPVYPRIAMLASPGSDDIFLFIAAAVASSAATAETTDVVAPGGGEVGPGAPLTVAAFEEAPTEPAAAAAAAGNAGRPLAAAAAAGEVAGGPWSPTTTPDAGLEFPGMDRVESGFFSCENQRQH